MVDEGLRRHIMENWIQQAIHKELNNDCPKLVFVDASKRKLELTSIVGLCIITLSTCLLLTVGKVYYLIKHRRRKIRRLGAVAMWPDIEHGNSASRVLDCTYQPWYAESDPNPRPVCIQEPNCEQIKASTALGFGHPVADVHVHASQCH